MAWPEKSEVECLLRPPVRRLGGDLMSGLSLHQAVFQSCGMVLLRESWESVGVPFSLPPTPRSLIYELPVMIIQAHSCLVEQEALS